MDGGTLQVKGFDNNEDNKQDCDSLQLINPKRECSKKQSKKNIPEIEARSKLRRLNPCSTKSRQWRYVNGIVVISSLGSFLWGYNFAIIAGAMLLIDEHFNLNVLWHEAIVSVFVVGATVGAAIAGTLNDKLGRWKVMMLSAILNVVAAVVMALAFSQIFLVVGRIIAGLALGMITLIAHYNNYLIIYGSTKIKFLELI